MTNFGDIAYGLTIKPGQGIARKPTDDGFEAIYTNPDYYKYQIVRTVDGSGNMTVSVKNYLGTDISSNTPLKTQIGGVVYTITSPLSQTIPSGSNWFNAGSSELATKEIDYFTYLGYNGSSVFICTSRLPYGNIGSDFNIVSPSNEKVGLGINNSTDTVTNIGRFNAILSAGPGYTWSIPANSDIRNYPIFETEWINGVPQVNIWTNAPTSITSSCKYKIRGNELIVRGRISGTANGSNSGTTIVLTTPFATTLNYLDSIQGTGLWTDNATFDEGDNITSVYNASNLIRLGFATSTRRPNLLTYSYSFPI